MPLRFDRALSVAFLARFTAGPGAALVRVRHEQGLDLRLRNEEVHVYDGGRRIAGVRGSPPRLILHDVYVPRCFQGEPCRGAGPCVAFPFDTGSVTAWCEALPALRPRAAAHAGAGGVALLLAARRLHDRPPTARWQSARREA